ncbi:TIGR03619 family F420-dependent LLM class oxidoreductase [Streptomyces sp. Qhu-G9]|uniref:TIGR03619 family F420-dependent LLM class oxidoreductase n=1 Tax=Streptomyces sp. Qhu-G9 TaxID=3452799 RepID=UPI0022ABF902|nr:TIGR03619 family F420-dependent LLM class oxidoreductase [Streptomyces aurantiacus]WAU82532.1 TIGR03619 family F420-dependent LLM class oxidoreductase [Streptomyces aurantiacus]
MTRTTSSAVRIAFLLSELNAVLDRNDLARTIDVARMAEDNGIDDVIVGEHIAMGPHAARDGLPENARAFMSPWHQRPDNPQLEGPTTLAAIAGATSRVRLVAAALLGALRHPVVMAKQLASLDMLSGGRLVVMPSVSWQPEESEACGVPFKSRGRVLDDAIGAWQALWGEQPASFKSDSFSFENVWCQPAPTRPGGPPMWFGGSSLHKRALDRIVRCGSGFFPEYYVIDDDWSRLDAALASAGRSRDELELVTGILPALSPGDRSAKLTDSTEILELQLAQGFRTFVVNPAQFVETVEEIPAFTQDLHRLMTRSLP